MPTVPSPFVEFNQALDGARILYRHYLTRMPPHEGWVREFTTSGEFVRISNTQKVTDAGLWHRVYDLRCEGVLEPGRAPALREPKKTPRRGPVPDAPGQTEFQEGGE